MKTVECYRHPPFKTNKITLGTKEWADLNVNCMSGCYNNCRYCYAKLMAKRFGRHTDDSWPKMKIRTNILRRSFKRFAGRVMFPSTHDIFDFEPFKKACFETLNKLLSSGNRVLVTTKPRLPVVEGIVSEFREYIGQLQFRFTITSKNEELLSFWEPNAPSYEERLASLRFAHKEGFRTSVSIEPFLDYDPSELVRELLPFTTESIWIGRMNYITTNGLSDDEKPYYNIVRTNYETKHLWEVFLKLHLRPKTRFKDSVVNQFARASRGENLPWFAPALLAHEL